MNPLRERVRAFAAAAPGEPALEDGDLRLTWASFDAEVEACALRLVASGVAPRDVVALRVGRSAAHVVWMLAVWQVDGVFLPLDPSQPDAHLDEAERRAGARWRVTLEAGGPKLSPMSNVQRLLPGDAAYVIFTSGSTGRPKAVQVGHAGLAALWSAQSEAFEVGPGDRVAWGLSPAFDASISDIGVALWHGATLVVVPDGGWVEALAKANLTCADVPPSVLARLDPDRLAPSLRTLVIGGEVCPAAAVRAHAASRRVINVYGPTEATVCSSLAPCSAESWFAAEIGSPLPGWRYRLVGEELWIGGQGIATGYLDEPALTSDRFVEEGGVRWYRTGDRVRHTDGRWWFEGRLDRQVKVRGQLVEPAEVERSLTSIDGVAEAAVVASTVVGATGGRTALVAHVVSDLASGPLRAALAARVPAHLIPQRFVFHAALPRTPAEKVDFAALADVSEPAGRPPDTDAERRMTRLWERALGRPGIGVNTDFFLAGGDSLALLDLVAMAEADGQPISPDMVLQNPTIRSLCVAEATDGGASADFLRQDALRLARQLWRARAPFAATPPGTAPAPAASALEHTEARSGLGALAAPEAKPRRGYDVGGATDEEPALSPQARAPWGERHAGDPRPPKPDRAPRRCPRQARPTASTLGIGAPGCGDDVAGESETQPDLAPQSWTLASDRPSVPGVPRTGPARLRPPRRRAATAILVTGATGALASRLIPTLITNTGARIIALVRARNDHEARRRLPEAWAVDAVAGDVSLPRFGLDPSVWRDLAASVDTVVHAAARVNLVDPYTSLRAPNVRGTEEVLRFQAAGRPKHLHHVSTLSVFVASDRNTGVALEDDGLDAIRTVFGGYAQSKFAAERLVRAAVAPSRPVSVHRLGLVTADRAGRLPPRDFLGQFIRGIAAIGAVPSGDLSGWQVDVTPIDAAARAIADIVSANVPSRRVRTYHLANARPISLAALVDALASLVPVTFVEAERWPEIASRSRHADVAPAVLAACRALSAGAFDRLRTMDLFQATGVTFDARNTTALLGSNGIPQVDETWLRAVVRDALMNRGDE